MSLSPRHALLHWMKSRPRWQQAILGWLSVATWPAWLVLWILYEIGRFFWGMDIQAAQTVEENAADLKAASEGHPAIR